MADPTSTRSSGIWTKIVALLLTAIVGWFFGAYVGSMFSAPVEIPSSGQTLPAAVSPTANSAIVASPGSTVALQPGATPSTIVVAPTSSVLIPTVAPTAPPTPTPPPGRGTSLEGLGFAVQLVDYELRPAEHPERAAVKYTLRFVNTSSRPVRTELNLADIRGIDNTGNIFGDYYAQANRVAETRCGIAANAPKYVENLTIQLPAQGVKQFDFFLTHVGAEGDCAEQGTARSRVDPITQFVDVQLGPIAYTSDTRRVLPSAWWRLTR